jgi:hypothetical protein
LSTEDTALEATLPTLVAALLAALPALLAALPTLVAALLAALAPLVAALLAALPTLVAALLAALPALLAALPATLAAEEPTLEALETTSLAASLVWAQPTTQAAAIANPPTAAAARFNPVVIVLFSSDQVGRVQSHPPPDNLANRGGQHYRVVELDHRWQRIGMVTVRRGGEEV